MRVGLDDMQFPRRAEPQAVDRTDASFQRRAAVAAVFMVAVPGYCRNGPFCVYFANFIIGRVGNVNVSFFVQGQGMWISEPGLDSRSAVARKIGFASAGSRGLLFFRRR